MITLSFDQAWTFFIAACSGLGLFAWLIWWLAAQFTSIRGMIHEKINHHDMRISRLEWRAGYSAKAPGDD